MKLMPIKKHFLALDDAISNDYQMIAIHSAIDDYKLAFHLNKNFPFHLERKQNNLVYLTENEKISPRHYYSFYDKKEFIAYFLIENKNLINKDFLGLGLFSDVSLSTETYFSKTFSKVDFFLILKGEEIAYKTEEILNNLKSIEFIRTSYPINIEKLKTTNYLLLN